MKGPCIKSVPERIRTSKHRDKKKKQLEAMEAGACVRACVCVLTWIFLMADDGCSR